MGLDMFLHIFLFSSTMRTTTYHLGVVISRDIHAIYWLEVVSKVFPISLSTPLYIFLHDGTDLNSLMVLETFPHASSSTVPVFTKKLQ
jgi:hypothetical protein